MRRDAFVKVLAIFLAAIPAEALVVDNAPRGLNVVDHPSQNSAIKKSGIPAIKARTVDDCYECEEEALFQEGYGYGFPIGENVNVHEDSHNHVDVHNDGQNFHENVDQNSHVDVHNNGQNFNEIEDSHFHEDVHVGKKDVVPTNDLVARCDTCTIAPENIQDICYGLIRSKVGGDFDIHEETHTDLQFGPDLFRKHYQFQDQFHSHPDGSFQHQIQVDIHIDVRQAFGGSVFMQQYHAHGQCQIQVDHQGRYHINEHIDVQQQDNVHKRENGSNDLSTRCDTCDFAPVDIQGVYYGLIRSKVGGDFDIHEETHTDLQFGPDLFQKHYQFQDQFQSYPDGSFQHQVQVDILVDVKQVYGGVVVMKHYHVHGHCQVQVDHEGRLHIDDHIDVDQQFNVNKREEATKDLIARCDTCTIAPPNIQDICYAIIRTKVGGDFDVNTQFQVHKDINEKFGPDEFREHYQFQDQFQSHHDGSWQHQVLVNMDVDAKNVVNGARILKQYHVHGFCQVQVDNHGRMQIHEDINVHQEEHVLKKRAIGKSGFGKVRRGRKE